MEWLTLITTFLQPILMKCWDKTSSEDPQQYLKSQYNSVSGRMNPDVVEDAIPATRRAVRQARKKLDRGERRSFPRYTREELYEIAEKSLIESMNATPETVASVRELAAGIPDDEE